MALPLPSELKWSELRPYWLAYQKRMNEPARNALVRTLRHLPPRVPDPPFGCGFDGERHSFRDYLRHIARCRHSGCIDRWRNHQDFRAEMGLARQSKGRVE